ncbi:MAG: hypothetical protein ACKO2Z_20550 [Sphaerospermopsis kisseleviana]
MHYIIKPFTGWEENFRNKTDAQKRATEIINKDEQQIRTVHNYKKPEQLVEEVWDSLEEMYQSISS